MQSEIIHHEYRFVGIKNLKILHQATRMTYDLKVRIFNDVDVKNDFIPFHRWKWKVIPLWD